MDKIITEFGTGEDLFKILQHCGLRGDPSLLPYERAEISIEAVTIESLVPLAKYVLIENIDRAALIYDRLKNENVDILNLPGLLTWWDNGVKNVIAPPVVEFWEEEGYLLVDGLHRVCLAQMQGRSSITCIVIRGVTTPLVPLPTVWEKIRRYPHGEMAEASEKRDYRFPDTASLKSAMPEIRDQVTDENYQYFLYRDLDALGSTGIREAQGDISTEGDSK
jgi:hypothetical protein